ncbi:hypothetical protein OPU71_10150 [Niveibacterium sp. 24ML]|uniref:hypothetical protein n=1 Tax=Niveibacterium sp. 24ML TaxID=2985512 RepID=UPI00226D739A|nr:hypothetical protein [Niveibacterium sp. 24ML]MCX9156482.1 hypothetical protein [Niveibacterium sp. 24ML]
MIEEKENDMSNGLKALFASLLCAAAAAVSADDFVFVGPKTVDSLPAVIASKAGKFAAGVKFEQVTSPAAAVEQPGGHVDAAILSVVDAVAITRAHPEFVLVQDVSATRASIVCQRTETLRSQRQLGQIRKVGVADLGGAEVLALALWEREFHAKPGSLSDKAVKIPAGDLGRAFESGEVDCVSVTFPIDDPFAAPAAIRSSIDRVVWSTESAYQPGSKKLIGRIPAAVLVVNRESCERSSIQCLSVARGLVAGAQEFYLHNVELMEKFGFADKALMKIINETNERKNFLPRDNPYDYSLAAALTVERGWSN